MIFRIEAIVSYRCMWVRVSLVLLSAFKEKEGAIYGSSRQNDIAPDDQMVVETEDVGVRSVFSLIWVAVWIGRSFREGNY